MDRLLKGQGQVVSLLVTHLRFFLQSYEDHLADLWRKLGIEEPGVWRLQVEMPVRERRIIIPDKRSAPGESFKEHNAKRVNIRPSIHLFAFALFGGHVFRSADSRARASQATASSKHLRNAKVGENWTT